SPTQSLPSGPPLAWHPCPGASTAPFRTPETPMARPVPAPRHRLPGVESAADLDRAVHHRPVAGEAAEELVRAGALDLADREADRGGLAAADHLAVGDHAGVVGLDVGGVGAGGHAVGGDAGAVR